MEPQVRARQRFALLCVVRLLYASRFFNEPPGAVVVQFENILTGFCSLHCA
jgi:hypothetical protein